LATFLILHENYRIF